MIVSDPDNLLDHIAQVEEDFNLPKGVESRRSVFINASYYWTANVNPNNVDQHIKYAKMGGFRLMNIYYPVLKVVEVIVILEITKSTNHFTQMESRSGEDAW